MIVRLTHCFSLLNKFLPIVVKNRNVSLLHDIEQKLVAARDTTAVENGHSILQHGFVDIHSVLRDKIETNLEPVRMSRYTLGKLADPDAEWPGLTNTAATPSRLWDSESLHGPILLYFQIMNRMIIQKSSEFGEPSRSYLLLLPNNVLVMIIRGV